MMVIMMNDGDDLDDGHDHDHGDDDDHGDDVNVNDLMMSIPAADGDYEDAYPVICSHVRTFKCQVL